MSFRNAESSIKTIYEVFQQADKLGKDLTLKDLRLETGIINNTIRGSVQKLVKRGLIERVGTGRTGRYRLKK